MTKLKMHSDTHPVLQQFTKICEKKLAQTHELLITARASTHMLSFKQKNKIPLIQRLPTMLNAHLHGFAAKVTTSLLSWLPTLSSMPWCWRVITAQLRDFHRRVIQHGTGHLLKTFKQWLNLKDSFTDLSSQITLNATVPHSWNLTFRFLTHFSD